MLQIIPTAEPFFFPGHGRNAGTGCLLIHGFTATPKAMRWLGEHLNQLGYTVLGIRIAGHATRPEDLIHSRWQDWLATVEDGVNLLRSCTNQTFLLGHSMGGSLSFIMAAKPEVRGVVSMSTLFKLPDNPLIPWSRQVSWFIPYVSKSKGTPGADWFDQEAFRQHVSYPKNPVRSVWEVNELLKMMREALPKVQVPVLLIHSHNDTYVARDSMEQTYNLLGTADKQMLWVEGGGHVITIEPTREQVFRAAAGFIERVSATA